MSWRFSTGPKGLIWVDGGADRQGFTEALNDSISALSPRGEAPTLSTYWIDHSLRAVRTALSEDEIAVAGGNATAIYRHGDQVVAMSLYREFEAESMTVEEFEVVLEEWRNRVEESIRLGVSIDDDLVHYQRNPWPD